MKEKQRNWKIRKWNGTQDLRLALTKKQTNTQTNKQTKPDLCSDES